MRLLRTTAAACTLAAGLSLTGSTLVAAPAATAVASVPAPGHDPAGPAPVPVADLPVSFTVRNVNRSAVPCASDGRTYTVRGHLVGPSRLLSRPRVPLATLYLHGLSFGEFFYRYQGARGYDYATRQAQEHDQVSVVVDRLGYVGSDKPDGTQVCVGSRADMAHQMVRALKRGDYRIEGDGAARSGPRSRGVVLAGHSYGGQIAQVSAYSFGGIRGLVVLGYADRVQSSLLLQSAAYAAQVCAAGGLPVAAGGPGGYAPFGPPAGAPAALFASAKGPIQRAVTQRLTVDPCGDTASFDDAAAVDLQRLGEVGVPVLVVGGAADALFPKPAAADQATLFTGSDDVTSRTLPDTGHAFTFERGRDRLVRVVGNWLQQLGR